MDDNSASDISQDIYNAATACRSSLQSCLPIKALALNGWADGRLADFNLWASGVGAMAKTKASLDWRLHYQPKARIVLVSILITLKDSIEECRDRGLIESGNESLDARSGEAENPTSRVDSQLDSHVFNEETKRASAWFNSLPSDSEGSDSSSTTAGEDEARIGDGSINEAMKATEDILDQLIRLGFAIRKSGTSSRLRKADSSFKEDNYQGLKNHLAIVLMAGARNEDDNFKKTSSQRAKDFETSYENLAPEQRQLILTNIRRRHRFNYARRHQQKMEEPPDLKLFPTANPAIEAIELPQLSQPLEGYQHLKPAEKPKPRSAIARHNLAMSTTTVSTVQGDILKVATPSQVSTRASVTTARLHYPFPPPLSTAVKSFKCPCCYQTLPVMFSDRDRWRKHVAEDLCPYTCPFSDCPTATDMYISRKDWRSHIFQKHGPSHYWQCLACRDMNELDTFGDVEEFTTHMRVVHQMTTNESQIQTMIDIWRVSLPPSIPVCPVCKLTQAKSEGMDPTAMLDHIGDCIHGFSLRALPWAEAVVKHDSKSASSVQERITKWLEGMEPIDIEGEPLTPKFTNTDSYSEAPQNLYVPDEYFADVSENSSAVEKASQISYSDLTDLDFDHLPKLPETWNPQEKFPMSISEENLPSEDEPKYSEERFGESFAGYLGDPSAIDLNHEPTENIEALLLYTARDGRATIVDKILRTGRVNVDTANSYGETPLLIASGFGLPEVALMCILHGADINLKDASGRTPLSLAAGFGDLVTTACLLNNEASVDEKDNSGRTPLFIAASNCNQDIADLLLKYGADIKTTNNEGQTLLEGGAGKQMVEFLRGHGSRWNTLKNKAIF